MIFKPKPTHIKAYFVLLLISAFGSAILSSLLIIVVGITMVLFHVLCYPYTYEVEIMYDAFIVRKRIGLGYKWQQTNNIQDLNFVLSLIHLGSEKWIKNLTVHKGQSTLYDFRAGVEGWDNDMLVDMYNQANEMQSDKFANKNEYTNLLKDKNVRCNTMQTQWSYIMEFKHKLDSKNVMYVPATPKEVEDAEARSGKKFPLAYKEFLLLAGREITRLDISEYQIHNFISFNAYADKLLIENGFESLGNRGLVIELHQGYSFFYFKDISADNPEVYLFVEGDAPVVNMLRFNSFTEYLIYKYNTMYERPEESFH